MENVATKAARYVEYKPLNNSIVKKSFYTTLEEQIKGVDVICFDVFDTLLRRPYLHPTHLFDALGCNLRDPTFGARRRCAEVMARKKYSEKIDVTIEQIYEFLDADLNAELALERESIYAREEVAEFVHFTKQMGKTTVGVSDTYLPLDFVGKILAKNNIWFDELFVSSEHQIAKFDGSAFRHLSNKLGVPFARMLHIGDNPRSDYAMPLRFGMKAVLLGDHAPAKNTSPHVDSLLEKLGSNGSFYSSSVGAMLRDIRFKHGHDNFWHDLGLYYAGPAAVSFCQWIRGRLEKNHIKKVVFLARDGWIPYLTFKQLYPNVESNYAYLSRAILVKSGLSSLSDIVLKNLVSGITAPASDYIKRLGDIGDELLQSGIAYFGGDPLIADDAARSQLTNFFLEQEEKLVPYGNDAKASLRNYLDQLGAFGEHNIAFVDVGWSGTGAAILHELFPQAESWFFLYFGTLDKFEPKKSRHQAYFFQLGQPDHHADLIFECVEIMEYIFSSSEESAIGLSCIDGDIVPLFPKCTQLKEKQLRSNAYIEAGAAKFVEMAKERKLHVTSDSRDLSAIFSIFDLLLRSNDLQVIKNLGGIYHQLGLGNSKIEPLISEEFDYWSVIRRWLRGKTAKKGKGHYYWPRQQEKFFIANQKGIKAHIAKWAYGVRERGGLKLASFK